MSGARAPLLNLVATKFSRCRKGAMSTVVLNYHHFTAVLHGTSPGPEFTAFESVARTILLSYSSTGTGTNTKFSTAWPTRGPWPHPTATMVLEQPYRCRNYRSQLQIPTIHTSTVVLSYSVLVDLLVHSKVKTSPGAWVPYY